MDQLELLYQDGNLEEALALIDTLEAANSSPGSFLNYRVRILFRLDRQLAIIDATDQIQSAATLEESDLLCFKAQALMRLRRFSECRQVLDVLEGVNDLDVVDFALDTRSLMLPRKDAIVFLDSTRERWGPKCVLSYCMFLILANEVTHVPATIDSYRESFPLSEPEFAHILAWSEWIGTKSKVAFDNMVSATFQLVDNEEKFLYTANLLINRNRVPEAESLINAVLDFRPRSIRALKLRRWCLLLKQRYKEWFEVGKQLRALEST